MKIKFPKNNSLILLAVILVFALASGMQNDFFKYQPSEKTYTKRVAYIDLQKALNTENFEVCDSTYIVDYYNRGRDDSIHRRTKYNTNKNGLRKEVMSKYKNRNYSDSGYLNFRFIVNCKGQAGAYVIHENDLDLNAKKFNSELVRQLFDITVGLKKWNPNFMRGKERDSYMYISYRIENGNITEIIP